MVLVTAAWPPGKCCSDPVSVWETCSKLCGVPVIVCNQTGYHERMDMREAESAVIVEGQRLLPIKAIQRFYFVSGMKRKCGSAQERLRWCT